MPDCRHHRLIFGSRQVVHTKVHPQNDIPAADFAILLIAGGHEDALAFMFGDSEVPCREGRAEDLRKVIESTSPKTVLKL